MSGLKNKSEINLDAAKVLIEKHNFYAPSVHCSYYSVLQLLKFTVNSSMGISYKDQEREIGSSRQSRFTARGTHEYLIEKIGDKIKAVSTGEFTDFNRQVKELKVFRRRSDYENIDITYEQSNKAYGLADEIRKLIKKIF
jgi:hypothetical protein